MKNQNRETNAKFAVFLYKIDFLNKNIQLYTTAKDTELRLTKQPDQIFRKRVQPLETEVSIFVNPNKRFQKYLGIGGAITDASSEVFCPLERF